jgi:hypothetical protein
MLLQRNLHKCVSNHQKAKNKNKRCCRRACGTHTHGIGLERRGVELDDVQEEMERVSGVGGEVRYALLRDVVEGAVGTLHHPDTCGVSACEGALLLEQTMLCCLSPCCSRVRFLALQQIRVDAAAATHNAEVAAEERVHVLRGVTRQFKRKTCCGDKKRKAVATVKMRGKQQGQYMTITNSASNDKPPDVT